MTDSTLSNTPLAIRKIKYPVQYSDLGTYIHDADGKTIADVRGWGWIQYLKVPDPTKTQDEIGQFIADAINEKLAALEQGDQFTVSNKMVLEQGDNNG